VLNISGGEVGGEVGIWSDSQAILSGGTLGDEFQVWGGRLLIRGGDFRLNGAPVQGLPNYGASATVDIPERSVLSGTLEDGTPFAFSDQDRDFFELGSVRLLQWPSPLPDPPTTPLAGGDAPTGVRSGHSVTVDAGRSLGDNFGAGWGSAVTIVGGEVGKNFEAVGAQVLIADGTVGDESDAFYGSEVTVTGGSIGYGFTAHNGSTVNILGGEIGYNFAAGPGSIVNVLGGAIGGRWDVAPGSKVHFYGTEFLLNGEPIPGLLPGQTATIDLPRFSHELSGRLIDGTELSTSVGNDTLLQMARVTVTIPMTADFDGDQDVDAMDLVGWKSALGSGGGGDADGDLDSDGADFLAWQRQYGSRAPAATSPSAAEPTTCGLALLAAAIVRCRRRLR
jgi:hypothetical protein